MNATQTKTARRYFVAVNMYRNSKSAGFATTWEVCECADKAHQNRILRHGLPARDAQPISNDGSRRAVVTTMGVRVAKAAEIRKAKGREDWDPIERIEWALKGDES